MVAGIKSHPKISMINYGNHPSHVPVNDTTKTASTPFGSSWHVSGSLKFIITSCGVWELPITNR